MKIVVVDNKTKNLNRIKFLFHPDKVSIVKRRHFGQKSAKSFDLVILSGGSNTFPVSKNPHYYKTQMDLVNSSNKPIIGICLGAQIIASALGCEITKLPAKIKGTQEIKIKKTLNKNKKIKVYQSHSYAITKLSYKVLKLASSKNGIEIIKHKTKPIYGLQFHPEILTPKNEGQKVFKLILKHIKSSR